ncbi:MAG TPA: phosphatase PAP2 family protein [Candidatus Paceibacterota bacterium]|nr:phosphatase PAP2 family protein [Candidatus Paceibacterota bacterium]
MKLFHELPSTLKRIYTGKSLLWQIGAVAITILIVTTGFDWTYYESTRIIPWSAVLPAVALGGLVPIVVPLALFTIGGVFRRAKVVTAGWALGQAALLGLVVSSTYKAFTGRIPPPRSFGMGSGLESISGSIGSTVQDVSHGFQFGFLRGGVFWGWPSSHTTVAFAVGAALFALLPRHKILRFVGVAWALYVGLGVSVSIHWFSEFAAGAIIGTVIGLAVGKAFRPEMAKNA